MRKNTAVPPPGEILSDFAFIRDMRPETRDRLHSRFKLTSVPPNTTILSPGDVVDGVYLVRAGAIRVYYLDADGHEGTLYWIEEGESCILALNSLFTEIPYPAWAESEGEGTEIIEIPGALFRELFAVEPSSQKFLFEQLSGRVFELQKLLERTMRQPQEARLILLLLTHADSEGVVHMSQEKLARHLGTVREVVARLLRNLASQGLVETAPRKVKLLDRARLEVLAEAEE
jgi:CRP/FNR family transcriptional regulator, anaerobic regulatory protein